MLIMITFIIIIIAISNSIPLKGRVMVGVNLPTKDQVIKASERQMPCEKGHSAHLHTTQVLLPKHCHGYNCGIVFSTI